MSEQPPQFESIENGKDVEIVLKFLRHGERTKEGRLTDYGRQITSEKAEQEKPEFEEFDAVKAIGSDAGLNETASMRALETADIYAHKIDTDKEFTTRIEKLLSYESVKTKAPYDHLKVYNSFLPENFTDLPDVEKAAAAKKAQSALMDHVLALDTPEAQIWKKETAGAFAYLVEHYIKMAGKLNSDSKVLMPAGTHGGTMEFLLQQALVFKNHAGVTKMGFDTMGEIGGEFSPSEAYNVDIKTDDTGDLMPLAVTFDSSDRPHFEFAYLNLDKVKELSAFYESLHSAEEEK